MKKVFFITMSLCMMLNLNAQKNFTMEETILGYHLYPKNKHLAWQGNSDFYTYIDETSLIREHAAKEQKEVVLSLAELNTLLKADLKGFPQYSWLDAETLIIRRQGKEYLINVAEKQVVGETVLPKGAADVSYSKVAGKYAFTRENNLYYTDASGEVVAVTSDKDKNMVNGQVVSRNEFGIKEGIFWSPDGKKLAFYRKDESRVGTFPLLDITTPTGSLKEIKYPMAGMDSEEVSLGVYDLETRQTVFMEVTDFGREQYLTNITWGPASDEIYIQVLNRGQDHLRLNKYNASTGKLIATLLEERASTYVEPQCPLTFVGEKGDRFIFTTNNRDGYLNLYLFNTSGKLIRNLTPVKADVELLAADPAGRYVYYLSSEISPVEKHLFRVDVRNGKRTRLTHAEGWHTITMSPNTSWFIDNYSSLQVPRVIEVASNAGKVSRKVLEAPDPFEGYNVGEITLGTIKADDGEDLYYRLIKPAGFDPARKYPVIHYVYGGPHSQMVRNNWKASLRMWEMYMAQRGYVVFVMDNHGTPNRGKAFEDVIHRRCGQQEMIDQLKGIEFVKSHPWVDQDRIGVHGWSYGGFMTITMLTHHPEIYKVGVAGGPVIDWKWYEAMYGERYMDTPQENPEGYEKSSLLPMAKMLKRKLLICQGMIDPVVVSEHSLSFVRECVKNNVQVDYFPYPCAEHNVMGKDRIHLMDKVTEYFDVFLNL